MMFILDRLFLHTHAHSSAINSPNLLAGGGEGGKKSHVIESDCAQNTALSVAGAIGL